MTKITHKGLWFKYSSLSDEDKKTSKKLFLSALLCGFLIFRLDDHKYLIIEKFFLDLVKLSNSILIKKK